MPQPPHSSTPRPAGHVRLTEPRRRILAVLDAADAPVTAYDVASRAQTSLASTYRVLGWLVARGDVSEITDASETAARSEARVHHYARCTADGHHHHFVCRSCHATLDVASDALERAVAETARNMGCLVEQHEVTLRGQCARCCAEEVRQ